MEINDHVYFRSENIGLVDNTFQCHICTTIFKHRGSLYNHLRAVHKVKNIGKKTIKCLEENCNACFKKILDLEKHLNQKHFREIDKEELLFESLEEFKAWKTTVEKDIKSNYVTYSPSRNVNVMYFKCSRSGFYKEKPSPGTRKRRLKSQGSKKSGAHCISRMIVYINNDSKTVTVKFCKTHYGHCMELAHVSLSKIEKENMCEHIDTEAWSQEEDTVEIPNEINKLQLTPVVASEVSVLTEEVTVDFNKDLNSERQKVLSILQSLIVKVNVEMSIEKLNAVKKYLKCSESLLNLGMASLPKETKECQVVRKRPKKKIELQDNYSYQFKKKRKTKNALNQGIKPDFYQKEELINSLLGDQSSFY